MLNSFTRYLATLFRVLILFAPKLAHGAAITIFSSGMDFPETITPVPQGFGAYGGQYFILDATRDFNVAQTKIWAVPAGGGAPTAFAAPLPIIPIGGVFLPSSGWGANSGNFLVSGEDGIYVFDSLGQGTRLTSVPGQTYLVPVLPPDSFNRVGQLMVAGALDGMGVGIFDVTAMGVVTMFAPIPDGVFGVAVAPAGFGDLGGTLVVGSGSAAEGEIFSVDSAGVASPVFGVGLAPGQFGFRNLAFSPPGFFPGVDQPLLFVSVSGSDVGGGIFGTLGDIKVFYPDGTLYRSLRDDLGLTKFDPRGMAFTADGLLVSDASDPIYLLQPDAFAAVPEPATLALVLLGVSLTLIGSGISPRRIASRIA